VTLSPPVFGYVSDLVKRESGIVLGPGKEYLVESRLLPLAKLAGLPDVPAYVVAVQRNGSVQDRRNIVEALTTNETSWFRDREPFSLLTDTIVPDLAAGRPGAQTLRVWSAACSTGQEPYSIAMALQEKLPSGWSYQVHGTDLSQEMISRAEKGQYTQLEMNRGLPATMLVKYFDRVGPEWQIAQSLRRNVSFGLANLASTLPSMQPFDVIFLRNVLIYFDVGTKRAVLAKVRKLLKPGGWLFLGAAETTNGIDADFERLSAGKTSAYRLGSGRAALATA
jgi:chemotaxis protein methyltransferase CheR